VEADFGWANAKSTLFGSPWPSPIIEAGGFVTGGSVNDSYLVKTPWDGSARLRAGWLVTPSTLLYLTGGVAWMHVETASNCSTVPTVNVGNCAPGAFQAGTLVPAVIDQAATRPGATIGGGIEVSIWSNWLLRVQYRFSDYGSVSFADNRSCVPGCTTPAFTPTDVTDKLRLMTHTAELGLAYRFGS
jgi:outer membrane immunogenic protein